MPEMIELPEWLWIIIETEKDQERLFGQHDQEENIFFIPAFYSQEEGEACLKYLQKVPERKYEIQAMRSAETLKAVQAHDYQLFILDGTGKVLKTLPEPPD
ncbi:MAG: hypothetical protein JRI34_02570 [Deltaproteobacteria bacterium]|nr:hypothetical protein [Deltaproteobacteria bacterium]